MCRCGALYAQVRLPLIEMDLNLMTDGQSLAGLTARIAERMDAALGDLNPDLLVVQGDTTTTMAVSLAAFYQRIQPRESDDPRPVWTPGRGPLLPLIDTRPRSKTAGVSEYMFGQPLGPDNVTSRFNQLVVRAGVRPIGPHQVRQLLASDLLDTGYGIPEVAERLGHDPGTLMRYYSRVNVVRRRQAADHIVELVAPAEAVPVATRHSRR
ncbi:hypothetical protein GCM10023322_10120 [Rugosimonospora acidiphila]|uniref:Tyr recombinase domain-containing protein n=1 Tax=Rugosimonospora acidiphila TaxID=556531 RepID=A0ABP9RMB2_9ACTN